MTAFEIVFLGKISFLYLQWPDLSFLLQSYYRIDPILEVPQYGFFCFWICLQFQKRE